MEENMEDGMNTCLVLGFMGRVANMMVVNSVDSQMYSVM